MIKKLLISLTVLGLSACGFTPMHAPLKKSDTSPLKNIRVELIESGATAKQEAGYHVLQHLRDRLGNARAGHILQIKPNANRRSFGLNSNDIAGRYDMNITVTYKLIDDVSGEVLDKGSVNSVTTYGAGNDPYARISSGKNAVDQVSRDAADRILVRIASYYKNPERRTKVLADKKKARTKDKVSDNSLDDIVEDTP